MKALEKVDYIMFYDSIKEIIRPHNQTPTEQKLAIIRDITMKLEAKKQVKQIRKWRTEKCKQ